MNFFYCKLCKEYIDNKNKFYVVCEICKLGYYKELYFGYCKFCENCDSNMCDGIIGLCNWGCEKGWYVKGRWYLCEYFCFDKCLNGDCEGIGGKCKFGC